MKRRIKAITVKQPFANLIAWGVKTIEVRSWPTVHRGALLITASVTPRIEPFGVALCVVELEDCRPLVRADLDAACLSDEAFRDGLFAWVLRRPRQLPAPVPIDGSLGLFDVDVTIGATRRRPRSSPAGGSSVVRRRTRRRPESATGAQAGRPPTLLALDDTLTGGAQTSDSSKTSPGDTADRLSRQLALPPTKQNARFSACVYVSERDELTYVLSRSRFGVRHPEEERKRENESLQGGARCGASHLHLLALSAATSGSRRSYVSD